jgi:hypothetical protein
MLHIVGLDIMAIGRMENLHRGSVLRNSLCLAGSADRGRPLVQIWELGTERPANGPSQPELRVVFLLLGLLLNSAKLRLTQAGWIDRHPI